MTAAAVEIIIPHHNGTGILRQCLQSLLQLTWQDLQITVVDNASTDDSVAMVEEEFPAVNLLRCRRNLGFAGGCNAGIRASNSPWVMLLNNDTEVEPGVIEPLVKQLQENPGVGAVQPRISSIPFRGYFDYAGAAGGMLDRWGYPFAVGRVFAELEPDDGRYRETRNIFWASGTAVLYRAAALEQVGLLDEVFFMHMEEIDLCWRLHLQGWEVQSVPQLAVYHHSGFSLPAGEGFKVYLNFRNSLLMLLKNYECATLWQRLPRRVLFDLIAMLRFFVKGDFRAFWGVKKAYLWLLFHPGTVRRLRGPVQEGRKLPDSRIDRVLFSRSIVWAHYIRGVRSFSELKWSIPDRELTQV